MMMDVRRVFLKLSFMGLICYYKTDFEGAFSSYANNMIDKLKIKTALENDLELVDIDVEVVYSAPRKIHLGIIKEGQIWD